MGDKYRLVPEGDLFRLVATRSFARVKEGELGGLVSGPRNLSHDGYCWIAEGAKALDQSHVWENATLLEGATTSDTADVSGEAVIYGSASVTGRASVGGRAIVGGFARVGGHSTVIGCPVITDKARVSGTATVLGRARVCESAHVSGRAEVRDSASVGGTSFVGGDSVIEGYTRLTEDARVIETRDLLNISFSSYHISAYRTERGPIYVSAGCQSFPLSDSEETMRHLAIQEGWPPDIVSVFRPAIAAFFQVGDEIR